MNDNTMVTTLKPLANNAVWVWDSNETSTLRLQRVRFRLEVSLAQLPKTALLTLSARTHYRLLVNSAILASGPARSYPEFREADTHDLISYLHVGVSHIEVEVLHLASASFHHFAEPPGFIAWGEITETDGTQHSLSTPGTWHCRRHKGIDAEAPPLSFAQGAIEIADLNADKMEKASFWTVPVPASSGETSTLIPRAIPPLTRISMAAVNILSMALPETETQVGACVSALPVTGNSNASHGQMAAAKAWLYSPCSQTVRLGSWWGDYWINGKPLEKLSDPAQPLRQTMNVSLEAGWNRICATGSIIFGYWEFSLAWPTDAKLSLHIEPRDHSPTGLELAGPCCGTNLDACREELVSGGPVPSLNWRKHPLNNHNCPPLRKLAWSIPTQAPAPSSLPLEVPMSQRTLITADMGGITLGSIALDIEAPAGTVLDIGHGEEATESGRPNYAKAFTLYAADRFVLQAGRQRIETFTSRGFRHLDVLVSNHSTPVTLHGIGSTERRYPYVFTGTFECSDPAFNRLWDYGRRTLELCSEDVLTDCPWRERTLYGGDLLAAGGAMIGMSRDLRLLRRSIEIFLQSYSPETNWLQSQAPLSRTLPSLSDYPLLVGISTAWYLRLTHDAALAKQAWPIFRGMLKAIEKMKRSDGLYSPPWGAFIDHGRKVCTGPTVAFNAALVAALRAFAETAIRAGNPAAAAPLNQQAGELEALLTNAYFDSGSGYFRDLPLTDGGRETEGSPAIVWPLLFAPATRSMAREALPALKELLAGFAPDNESKSVSPYQMFYLLALLRELGEAGLAENTIRRVYALMLEKPTGTLWEVSRPSQSLTHAWSCGINDYLATTVLGVRMGFDNENEVKTILVSPCAASLDWAKGTVPHPLGDVFVEWRRTGDRLSVTVKAPPGVPVKVVPAGPLANLKLDLT